MRLKLSEMQTHQSGKPQSKMDFIHNLLKVIKLGLLSFA